MLKKYKNRFVQKINQIDFKGFDFEILYTEGDEVQEDYLNSKLILKIKNAPFFFSIRDFADDWDSFEIASTRFIPGYPEKRFPLVGYLKFSGVLNSLDDWINKDLAEYSYEKNQPDLLTLLIDKKENNLTEIDFEDNSHFSKNEEKLVIQGLREIKLLLKEEFNFSKAQMNIIENRLEYLELGVKRLGKTDWKGILISTIFSIITTLALDAEKAEQLFQLFVKVIQNIPKLYY